MNTLKRHRWLALAGSGLGLILVSPLLFPALALAGWALFLYGTTVIIISILKNLSETR